MAEPVAKRKVYVQSMRKAARACGVELILDTAGRARVVEVNTQAADATFVCAAIFLQMCFSFRAFAWGESLKTHCAVMKDQRISQHGQEHIPHVFHRL